MIRRAAVIGSPVAHSRSPTIFGVLAAQLGRADLEYTAREVQPGALAAFLDEVRHDPTYVGLNVTLPHKEACLAHLDALSEEARDIGAVNVIERAEVGLRGLNTDVRGIERTLDGHAVEGRDALILGAGGAARAVAWVLRDRGARTVFVWSRRAEAAAALAERFGTGSTQFVATTTWDALPPLALIAQTTPAGMKGVLAEPALFAPLATAALTSDALAFDLVYTPPHTPFLAAARARGMRAVGGLPMLVDQALATWAAWFGPIEPEAHEDARSEARVDARSEARADARAALLDRLAPPIFLTGFMGAGKSTVGALLARRLGTRHVDVDRAIEARVGLTIAAIFAQRGEPAFRRLEREVIAELTDGRAVIALGGGALLDPETRARVARAGTLVYLAATPATLEARLGEAADRPLLAGLDGAGRRAKIAAMLADREPLYRTAAVVVDTDDRTPDAVVAALLEVLR